MEKHRMLKLIRFNLMFFLFFLIVYTFLFLRRPSSTVSMARHDHKIELVVDHLNAVVEETPIHPRNMEKSEFLDKVIKRGKNIGIINMDERDDLITPWRDHGVIIPIHFEKVSDRIEWRHIFPEWIDEEEVSERPSCPHVPLPDSGRHEGLIDVVVARVPCRYPSEGWGRDVERLQVLLAAASMAARTRTRKVVIWSKCRPMIELFRCEDLVRREGDWWYYEVEVERLKHKLSLPVGSCQLAMPNSGVLDDQGINEEYEVIKAPEPVRAPKREAYASVLHSSEAYVCGAITLAQSLLRTGTQRDLILLLDASISAPKRTALAAAGWRIRVITRIRNPRAKKKSYNEYNYTKLRLWLLTDYDKIVFVDSDVVALRNLDALFDLPEMSGSGNDGHIFNSGVMVIEPSECTFKTLISLLNDVVSYNGGDQGFLNEVFVFWHRIPKTFNFLKNFWSGTVQETVQKNRLFEAEPARLHAVHYLGIKPWQCYRDYDCNFEVEDRRVYASDVAHRTWWRVYDGMEEGLKRMCGLSERRRAELESGRRKARRRRSGDEQHWRINVRDPRRLSKNLI